MGRLAFVVVVAVASSSLAQAAECFPACRSGFVCHQGQCVSRCNPQCPEGSQCLDSGECTAVSRPAAPVAGASSAGLRVNQGWASGAGVLGIVSSVVIAGLVGLTIAFNGTDAATYVGAVATLFAGISIPLVAVGAGSARSDERVTGSPGWRTTGWIAYVLCMIDAVVAVGLGVADVTVPSLVVASIGLLGIIAAASHSADAFASAAQAGELQRQSRGSPLSHSFVVLAVPKTPTAPLAWGLGWRTSW